LWIVKDCEFVGSLEYFYVIVDYKIFFNEELICEGQDPIVSEVSKVR
jgi:hypothetical protein